MSVKPSVNQPETLVIVFPTKSATRDHDLQEKCRESERLPDDLGRHEKPACVSTQYQPPVHTLVIG